MKLKQIRHILIVIVFFVLLICCNKEKDSQPVPDFLIIDNTSTLNTDMNDINHIIYCDYFHQLANYQIDLNNDNIDDIEFTCNIYAHTIYDNWSASVKTLHDNIAIDVISEPILIARYFYYYSSPSGDSIKYECSENFNKDKAYPSNLKIDTLIETGPVLHSNKDTLKQGCNWESGSFTLLSNNRISGVGSENIHKGKWEKVEHKFIGVEFLDRAEPYYGWIELSENGYEITLHKYGLANYIKDTIKSELITDIDGNEYHSIKIGDQFWLVENLATTHYRNGDPIETTIPENLNISESTNPYQWVYYGGSEYMKNESKFGRLYNWFSVIDTRNICPEGWHIPTNSEWTTLINFLGGNDVAGGKMKRTGTVYWEYPNYGTTNESGFSALAGGIRFGDGEFSNKGEECHFWSSTIDPSYSAAGLCANLKFSSNSTYISGIAKVHAVSVRCIKD